MHISPDKFQWTIWQWFCVLYGVITLISIFYLLVSSCKVVSQFEEDCVVSVPPRNRTVPIILLLRCQIQCFQVIFIATCIDNRLERYTICQWLRLAVTCKEIFVNFKANLQELINSNYLIKKSLYNTYHKSY